MQSSSGERGAASPALSRAGPVELSHDGDDVYSYCLLESRHTD